MCGEAMANADRCHVVLRELRHRAERAGVDDEPALQRLAVARGAAEVSRSHEAVGAAEQRVEAAVQEDAEQRRFFGGHGLAVGGGDAGSDREAGQTCGRLEQRTS